MANADAQATYWNTPQYHGRLLTMFQKELQFLTAIGFDPITGTLGGKALQAPDWSFPLASQNQLDASSQKSITETASLTAPTPRNYDRSQPEVQVAQIFQYGVGGSYAAQSALKKLSGLAIAEPLEDVNDPIVSNLNMTLKQMAQDVEWHMLNGTYNLATTAGTANQMRGLVTAISTCAVDAGGDALTTADVDAMLLLLEETAYAPMKRPVFMGRFSVQQKLSALYGVAPFAPVTNNIGTIGQGLEYIKTDGGTFPFLEVDQMPAATIVLADLDQIAPVFLPKPERNGEPGGYVFVEPLAKTGAATKLQLYGQMSIGYTTEAWHGKITNFL
jgi:hypothetical protein